MQRYLDDCEREQRDLETKRENLRAEQELWKKER